MQDTEAWGWCTGMTQRDGMEREVGGGTHVHPWRMHVDVWQNQYNIVKFKNNNNNKNTQDQSPLE